MNKSNWIWVGAAALIGLGAVYMTSADNRSAVNVKLPTLSAEAQAGKALFNANCAKCHGKNGAGTDNGPPFINKIYRPGHHGDVAFQRAARYGVRAHHWRFGNMPPVPGVSQADVAKIVVFIREVQRANGVM